LHLFDAIAALLLASTTSGDFAGAILGLLIALIVIGVPAVFAFGFSLRWAWREAVSWTTAICSRWWPGVPGEVVRSEVEVLGLPAGVELKELSSRPNWNRRHRVEFATRFSYRYMVQDRPYEG
jgi:hypothetical protein